MAKIEISTTETNPFVLANKKKLLEKIAKQDSDVLDKLVQLGNSTKAINYLKDSSNWEFLKSMLM